MEGAIKGAGRVEARLQWPTHPRPEGTGRGARLAGAGSGGQKGPQGPVPRVSCQHWWCAHDRGSPGTPMCFKSDGHLAEVGAGILSEKPPPISRRSKEKGNAMTPADPYGKVWTRIAQC